MARNLTAPVIAELTAGRCVPILLCQAKFKSGTQYMWSGVGDLSWNGHTWIGLGQLAGVSPMPEGTDIAAEGVTLTLDGVPSQYVQQALTECRQGYPVILWLGFLNSSGVVIANPFESFAGRMDVPTIEEGADTCKILLTVESRLKDLKRSTERRFTDQDQQLDYPGDLGFGYVAALQEKNVIWGKGEAIGNAAGNSGRYVKTPEERGEY